MKMKRILLSTKLALVLALSLNGIACINQSPPNSNSVTTIVPTPAPSPSPMSGVVTAASTVPVTLPVLDALFADEAFKAELKSKLQLTDEQIDALRKISSEAVTKLRQSNAENQSGSAEVARQSAIEAIRGVIGPDKSEQLSALARDHWNRGSEESATAIAKNEEPVMLPGPNAVPTDTRIVVNIPAFRMDVFRNGSLIKSY